MQRPTPATVLKLQYLLDVFSLHKRMPWHKVMGLMPTEVLYPISPILDQ